MRFMMIKKLITLCLLTTFSLSAHPEYGDDERECPRFAVEEERENEEARDCCDEQKEECDKYIEENEEEVKSEEEKENC